MYLGAHRERLAAVREITGAYDASESHLVKVVHHLAQHGYIETTWLTFAVAMVWTYPNLIEYSSVWYGADAVAKETLLQRATGPYAFWWWSMNFLGSVVPFALIFKKLRANLTVMMIVSLLLNLGMWLERWMIVTPTFSHGWYPWTWEHAFFPSRVQWGIVFGSFGWFGMLFCKLVPSVSMYEVKEMVFHRKLAKLDVRGA